MMKRFVAITLTVILAWSSGLLGLAEAYAAAQPVVIEKTDEYTIWQNADGTRTIRMECTVDEPTDPEQPEVWLEDGESWTNEGMVAKTRLSKTYEKNQALVTLSKNGTSISFAPLMNAEQSIPPSTEVGQAYQVNETQTSSNSIRVSARAKRRPESVKGTLRGKAARFGVENTEANAGTTAAYDALFDEESSVELIALSGGVKENIIVSEYTGNHVYAYRMTLQGLTAKQNGQEILLLDGEGTVAAQVCAPNMNDASDAYSEEIAVSLENEGGGVYRLTYIPSDDWMQAAAYPVTIDPTAKYFNDVARLIGQAYVSSAAPGTNFAYEGYGTYLHKLGYDGNANYYLYVCPVLIGSELANAGGSPFPAEGNVLIQSARWGFRNWGASGQSYDVFRVNGSWNPMTITYNNRPDNDSKVHARFTPVPEWNYVDVTSLFSEWMNTTDQKPVYGLVAKATNPSAYSY